MVSLLSTPAKPDTEQKEKNDDKASRLQYVLVSRRLAIGRFADPVAGPTAG
jgi:hypothetical protein